MKHQFISASNKRKIQDRRIIERRTPKRGVNIRHDDELLPKRIRNNQTNKDK